MSRPLCGLLALLLWGAPAPLPAVVNSTLQVSAQVAAGCLLVGGASTYGTLDFGSYSALSSGDATSALGGPAVTLQCTPGVKLSLRIEAGQHYSDQSRHLKRTGGSELVAYQLFSDPGFSQRLEAGQSMTLAYSDANAIKLPVYGRAQLTGNLPAGSYTDVVQVVLSW